jgi:peptidoglycan lytic transglycosylase
VRTSDRSRRPGRPSVRSAGRRGRMASTVALVALACVTAGCSSSRRAPPVASTAGIAPGYSEIGLASWYGEPYHGRPTASGERYDMWQMTAAHRTLPFGTRVRVTNRDTGRSATVLINDRGPFVSGRILDLSRGAAEALGAVAAGVIPVRLEVVAVGDGMVDAPCWEVQVGAFAKAANARRTGRRLRADGYAVRFAPAGGGLTRVRVTDVGRRDAALALASRLQSRFPGATALPCGGGW